MGIAAVPAIFAQLAGGSQGWAAPDEGKGGLGAEGIWGWQVWGEGVQLGERLLFVSRHMEFIRDCVFSARWGWMGLSVPSCLVAEGGARMWAETPKYPHVLCSGLCPLPVAHHGVPKDHRDPLHPYGKKAGSAWGTGGPCLAWGLARSQSNRWWSLPPPTGHAGKYLCPDFAGRREGISFLRPPAARPPGINPFTTPGDGGRCPPWCPPCGQRSGQGVRQGSIWCRWLATALGRPVTVLMVIVGTAQFILAVPY